jgi:hypothetical protein
MACCKDTKTHVPNVDVDWRLLFKALKKRELSDGKYNKPNPIAEKV